MAQTVIGVFDDATEAQEAVTQLVSAGFSRDNIDVSVRNTSDSMSTTNRTDDDDDHESGISRFFSSLFGSDDDEDTRKYSTVASRGSVVTVHVQSDDEAERAADLLDDAGAVDVDERAAQYGYTSGVTGSTATGATLENQVRDFGTDDTGMTAKVIEENLQVGKRVVETGGARLRSRIVERPVEESVRLRQERVTVQRTPVDRPATEADFTSFKEGEVELVERAEVPVVGKEARVVEEVSLGKQVEERDETIRDTVRKTEVDVENLGTDTTRLTNDPNRPTTGSGTTNQTGSTGY